MVRGDKDTGIAYEINQDSTDKGNMRLWHKKNITHWRQSKKTYKKGNPIYEGNERRGKATNIDFFFSSFLILWEIIIDMSDVRKESNQFIFRL